MPDDDDLDLDDDELEEAELVKKLRGVIKAKTKHEKELEQQIEEGATATRKLAIMDAKLPDTPQVKFFLDNYKGDLDPSAIRSKAVEYGFIEADKKIETEVDGVDSMLQVSVGAEAPAGPGSDTELMEKIKNVPPGPGSADKIKDIMISYGRYVPDEV